MQTCQAILQYPNNVHLYASARLPRQEAHKGRAPSPSPASARCLRKLRCRYVSSFLLLSLAGIYHLCLFISKGNCCCVACPNSKGPRAGQWKTNRQISQRDVVCRFTFSNYVNVFLCASVSWPPICAQSLLAQRLLRALSSHRPCKCLFKNSQRVDSRVRSYKQCKRSVSLWYDGAI